MTSGGEEEAAGPRIISRLMEHEGQMGSAGRASFLMTFVQSGMPPRLPAHDQRMLSHDISACSAT